LNLRREFLDGRMRITVECYAGYRADERPVRFVLNGEAYEVLEVEDRWYSPQATYFRLLADDRNRYVLRHDEARDVWSLEAFRGGVAEDRASKKAT